MIRYCVFCGQVIPVERLDRSLRARFCSDQHRFQDSNERRRVLAKRRADRPAARPAVEKARQGASRHEYGVAERST
jgi:RNA polymerase-binding transcription factor DksA